MRSTQDLNEPPRYWLEPLVRFNESVLRRVRCEVRIVGQPVGDVIRKALIVEDESG